MNINYVKELHRLNRVETQPLVKTIKKHLFDYAVEAEITQNTVSVPLSVGTATEESK